MAAALVLSIAVLVTVAAFVFTVLVFVAMAVFFGSEIVQIPKYLLVELRNF